MPAVEVPTYDLPPGAVAQTPAEPRDSARLLDVLDPGGALHHRRVRDLPELLGPGDVLVINNTRVIPARLRLTKPTGGAAEILLVEADPLDERSWEALVRPGRRLAPGTRLVAAGRELVEVGERLADRRRQVRLLADPAEVMEICGEMALPPYITQGLEDQERYQTVYAEHPGSVAAPTAGLHLTADVLEAVRKRGATVATLDLTVGLATFRPVVAERAEEHVMHFERYRVPAETWEACRRADRVVAVGTTVVRALETVGERAELQGSTDLFIRPGFEFSVVDALITNFHLPRSSLLLLLEAFMGPRWREVYRAALDSGYRFLSFGDAMITSRA